MATVTGKDVSARIGNPFARSVVLPALPSTTVIEAVPAPAANVAVAGTEAIAGLSDDRFTVNTVDAGEFNTNVAVRVVPVPPAISSWPQLNVPPTDTDCVRLKYPGEEAMMLAEPKPTPVTSGVTFGRVAFAANVICDGLIVTAAGFELLSDTTAPFEPAGLDN